MSLWAYAHGPQNDPLIVRSRTQKMTLWAYTQGPKKWPFECMLKDPKINPLSVCSRTHFHCTFSHAKNITFTHKRAQLTWSLWKWICYVNVENHFLTYTKHIIFARIMLGAPFYFYFKNLKFLTKDYFFKFLN